MPRSIVIPGVPPVDISPFGEIIDSRYFQALRGRKQLGVNHLVFPGAAHTRFEHAVGALSLSQRLCTIHGLTGDDARHIQVFALLHDIGHGPFSHQIEPVLEDSHHSRGIMIVRELAPLLEKQGFSPLRLENMFLGKDPLEKWVSDRNLGADKLDYLSRDALHIGFRGTPDIERIQYYTVMTPDGPAINAKFIEDAKQLQKFYSYLHQHGYLNKTALSAQRMLQRACQEALKGKSPAETADIWNMEDWELEVFLRNSGSELAMALAQALARRHLHRSFLVLKPTGYAYVEQDGDKQLRVIECQRSELRSFCDKYKSLDAISALEDELSLEMGLPAGTVLFAAMPYFTKLVPRDLKVVTGSSEFWLFDKDLDHKRSLESDYLRTFAVRLVCPPEFREFLAQNALHIYNRIFGNG